MVCNRDFVDEISWIQNWTGQCGRGRYGERRRALVSATFRGNRCVDGYPGRRPDRQPWPQREERL